MLHALLQTGGHPSLAFKSRCGDVVSCGRICVVGEPYSRQDRSSAVELRDVDVLLTARITSPSLTENSGWVAIAVNVQNLGSLPGYVRLASAGQSKGCAFG
jgi:hypothetical protein